MRRRQNLVVESLESRALLSGLTGAITTNQSVYEVGEPIEMTFTLTNTSSTSQAIAVGPSNSAFIVTEGGQTVWRSSPGVAAQYLKVDTLDPGQSLTLQATWDGSIVNGTSTTTAIGSFSVTNQLDPSGVSASLQIDSSLTYQTSVSQSDYPFGSPVQLSYTITNTSSGPVTFNLAPVDFVVTQSGNPVWESDPGAASQAATPQTLQPGQSTTETGAWDGVAGEGLLAGTNVWGNFSLAIAGAPDGVEQPFQIDSPITQSVTTDQSAYQAGATIKLTATETNISAQAVTIDNADDMFTLVGVTGVSVPPANLTPANAVTTLEPGQSRTFVATLQLNGGSGPTAGLDGQYEVRFSDDFQSVTSATFTIDGTGGASGPPVNPSAPPSVSSPVVVAVIPDHATSRAGEPLRIRIAIKNTAKTTTKLTQASATDRVTVRLGSTIIWTRLLTRPKVKTLKHGQSVSIDTVWNGKANQGASRNLSPGIYTIEVDEAGMSASASIRIR